jgi:hypothetical protein
MAAVTTRLKGLGDILAAGLRATASRLDEIDGRLRDLRGVVGRSQRIIATDDGSGGREWDSLFIQIGAKATGRVLYCGPNAESRVTILRSNGSDAYGLVTDGDPYLSHPDIRFGDLREHLASLPDGSLDIVALAGLEVTPDLAYFAGLVEDLRRVAKSALVIAEAPWSWRERVGTMAADLAALRPLSADTWIEALSRAGYQASARYSSDGSTYAVNAADPPEKP